MTDLVSLRPVSHRRLMDLVQEAGIDDAAWADFKGGESRAATNPRYCYEWAFEKPGRFVVLNIWYRDIRPAGRRFILEANLRASAAKHGRNRDGASSLWQKRADRFDQAVALAASDGLPVRAVICDGIMRRATEGRASKVQKRDLDPVTWAVTFYDTASGAFTLTRGALQTRLVDQFNAGTAAGSPTETRSASGVVFVRDPRVRATVLARANGLCEWCHQPGFATPAGDMFLETHHVIPLDEGGADVVANVVALCPNHHREAHFGSACAAMRSVLLRAERSRQSRAPAV